VLYYVLSSLICIIHTDNRINRFLSNLDRIGHDSILYFITAPSLTDNAAAASEKQVLLFSFYVHERSYLGDIRFRVSFSHAESSQVFGTRCRKRRAAGDSCHEFFHVLICCLLFQTLDTSWTIINLSIDLNHHRINLNRNRNRKCLPQFRSRVVMKRNVR